METSTEADSDLAQSEPWTMLEDSDIEVCDEPSKTKEVEPRQSEASQDEEEDDFAKLRKHRKFIEQLETNEDLSWDPLDITASAEKSSDPPVETTAVVCTRCSICSVLLSKGGTKFASYLCNTFLALCVLAVASGLAYYFQFPDQLNSTNIKNVLARYTQSDYSTRVDRYIEPKYEKNKNQMYYDGLNHQKYEDTTRKQEKKEKNYYQEQANYGQKDYKKKKESAEKRRYNKNDPDEKRYIKKDFAKKAFKQDYREFKQKKNSKSKGDYKRK